MPTVFDNLGNNIKNLRLEKGWTQEDLAYYADVTASCISQLERCISNPTLKTLEKIANALEIETANLLQQL